MLRTNKSDYKWTEKHIQKLIMQLENYLDDCHLDNP